MFVSIKLISDIYNYEAATYNIEYLLEDTDFVIKLHTPVEKEVYENRWGASMIPSGLIHAYTKMEKSVPKNIAMFYLQNIGKIPAVEQNRLLNMDMEWTQKYFPDLDYKNKYFRCVKNQMAIYNYIGISRHAKSFA